MAQLPIYLLEIDETGEQTQVSAVALVDRPAIEKNWLAFKDHRFAFAADEDKHILTGALMLADFPIYRVDPEIGEYNAVFSAQTIEKIAQKYHEMGNQSSVNIMHDAGAFVEGVTMFESWIVNRELGKMPLKGNEDAKDGSWFGSFKVNNPEVWQAVKDGTIKGFSVEGVFTMKPAKQTPEQVLAQVAAMLENIEL
jgi:hypothetical protein